LTPADAAAATAAPGGTKRVDNCHLCDVKQFGKLSVDRYTAARIIVHFHDGCGNYLCKRRKVLPEP